MPRKPRRSRLRSSLLTDDQREELLFGFAFHYGFEFVRNDGSHVTSSESSFANASNKRTAWMRYRSELMAQCQPGHRPRAFYRLDLGLNILPCRWPDELNVLLDHNLIDADEAVRIEASTLMLSPKQNLEFCCSFEDPRLIAQMRLSPSVLDNTAHAFDVAARWHLYRDRPTIAERYRLRAAAIRELLAASDRRPM